MLDLRVLGSLDLRDASGFPLTAVLSQPKRAALLVFLTLAEPRGFRRRDELIALFWPETIERRARNALNQSLTFLRRGLPPGVLQSRGPEEVGVNHEAVRCDAIAFEWALATGDAEAALALYRGPFLSAFHLAGSDGFDRWAEEWRNELRDRAADAAWTLAGSRIRAGAGVEAERVAQRAMALVPGNEAAVVEFIAALHRAGDRAAATRFYDKFRIRLRDELGIDPSPLASSRVEALLSSEPDPSIWEAPPPEPRFGPESRKKPEVGQPPAVAGRVGRFQGSRRALLLLTALLLAFGGFALVHTRAGTGDEPGPGAAERSEGRRPPTLAVLPLVSRSGLDADSRFADGMHAELLTRLGRVSGLRVLSRAAVLDHRDGSGAERLRRELEVDYLIEAGVARSGDSVRVDARLVDATSNTQVWAQTYDRKLTAESLLHIQADITHRVVLSVRRTLATPASPAIDEPATDNLHAYEWFLLGAAARFAGYIERDIRHSIHCYEQAVTLDPSFAVAWARLSLAHSELFWFFEPTAPRAAAALRALNRAAALAPDNPETKLAFAVYAYRVRRDYEAARREITVARDLLPNDHRVHHLLGAIARRTGRWDEAVDAWHSAAALDPASATTAMELGVTYWLLRRFDEAADHLTRSLELDPSLVTAAAILSQVEVARNGNAVAAAHGLESAARAGVAIEENPFVQHTRAELQLLAGRPAAALRILELERRDFLEYQYLAVPPALLRGQAHALLGHRELARGELTAARRLLEERLEAHPDDPRLHSALGLALAGLGDAGGALQHAERAVELLPVQQDAWFGTYFAENLAVTHALLGNDQAAADLFADLLASPGPLSRQRLRLDPRLAALRSNARFAELLRG